MKVSAGLPNMKLDSYDRFFPNQDFLPKGGFGNLIALPLQRNRRKSGCTVFVDENFEPYADQWKILSGVYRYSLEELKDILSGIGIHDDVNEVDPTKSSIEAEELILEMSENSLYDLPVLNDQTAVLMEDLSVSLENLSGKMQAVLKRIATIPNPVFFEKQKQRFPTYNIPKYIFSGSVSDGRLHLPRGCLGEVIDCFANCGSRLTIEDRRLTSKKIRVKFDGELRNYQKVAVEKLQNEEFGVLVAPPGSGKTVMACSIIAKKKVSTLVIVNRQTLLDQWKSRLGEFLLLEGEVCKAGEYSGKRKKPSGKIDVASLQTLVKLEFQKKIFQDYGLVIIDECHHVPAVSVISLLEKCTSRNILGLTATPKRKDRLEKLLYFQCGSIKHVVSDPDAENFQKEVFVCTTGFNALQEDGNPLPIHLFWDFLTANKERNRLIAKDIVEVSSAKRKVLVLSDRKEHLNKIIEAVQEQRGDEILISHINGVLSKKNRESELSAFRQGITSGKPSCLFATASLIGEGFDMPELDTLVLAMPISFKGRLIQYAGRLHRRSKEKKDVRVYDYLDRQSALASSMFRKRSLGYKEMGYTIRNDEETWI